jgi:Icc-related predicted phosphoesterase
MKICHLSDSHGLPRKPIYDNADVVVHTGDMLPNRTRGNRDIEPGYQEDWLVGVMKSWAAWLGTRPLVYVAGNHDFFDPIPLMRRAGMDAHNVLGTVVKLQGLSFMGLPDIPWMGGEWNHERWEEQIAEHISAILDYRPDVVLGHCPPHGLLDAPYANNPGYHIGSTAIANALTFHWHEPKAYLCGHCHEHGGKEAKIRNTIISNAATTRRLVEL